MRLLLKTADTFKFEVEWIEIAQLQELLRHYPLTPLSEFKISRPAANGKKTGDQPLLDAAMAAQQQALRRKVRAWLGPGGCFTLIDDQYQLTLRDEEMEGLLQALNDVRVGCWIRLGCPEKEPPVKLDAGAAVYHLLMETALWFEVILLRALDGPDNSALPEEHPDPDP